tara:strand:+ start:4707 stop:5177 length:471 start_codon:yes stop_codon:yes gene_type:complete
MANPFYGQNSADNAIDVGSCVYAAADITLLSSQAGGTVIMADSAAKTIKLPTDVVNGMTFDFAYVAAAAEGHDITIDTQSDTNYFVGGLSILDTDATTDGTEALVPILPNGSSNSKAALKTVDNGTWFRCVNYNNVWYMYGQICSATATAVVYADQ